MRDPREHPAFDQAKWLLLGDAVDDVQGIWEPLWSFRGNIGEFVRVPPLDEDARQLWAETVLRELYRDGLIAVFRSPWDGDRNADADNEAPRPEEIEVALASDHWRSVPLGATDIWFVATDKGEQTYYALPSDTFASSRG